MRDTQLNRVVAAPYIDAIVSSVLHFQSTEVPEVSVQHQATVAGRKCLRRKVQYWPLTSKGKKVLWKTHDAIVTTSDGYCGGKVIRTASHEDS